MSGRSHFKRIEQMPPDVFAAEKPLSAYAAMALRSNAQHLVDSAHGYCINIVSQTGAGTGSALCKLGDTYPATGTAWWHTVFPIIPANRSEMPKFHVKIATAFDSGPIQIGVSYFMRSVRFGDTFLARDHLVSDGTPAWSIDEKISFAAFEGGLFGASRGLAPGALKVHHDYRPHPDDGLKQATIFPVLFSVSLSITDGAAGSTASAEVIGVSVREYV